MSRQYTATIHCDADDCDNWSLDYYQMCASEVDGMKVDQAHRAPGWAVICADDDICPECREFIEADKVATA
jgi:hypothetical protein